MNNIRVSMTAAALAATAAQARRLPQQPTVYNLTDNQDFANWMANNNRGYTNRREFRQRARLYQQTDDMIEQANYEADHSEFPDAVRLAHNMFSDRTDEEKADYFGAQFPSYYLNNNDAEEDGGPRGGPPAGGPRGGRRDNTGNYSLSIRPSDIDWIAEGKVHPVKSQGGCGSCYAFTAMTVLEAQIAIVEDSTPVRLSEQQVVDCSHYYDNNYEYYNWGCSGGWPGDTWNYARDKGMMTNDHYDYKGWEQDCAFQDQPDVEFDIIQNEMIDGWESTPPLEIFEALRDIGPMSIAMQANCNAFMHYAGGVLRDSDCTFTGLDHVIVLTGYSRQRTEEYVRNSTRTVSYGRYTDDQDPEDGCRNENETYWAEQEFCVWEVRENVEETFSGAPVWEALNSWGEWWGKGGLVHMEVSEGQGFQGMNNYVEKLQISNVRHNS